MIQVRAEVQARLLGLGSRVGNLMGSGRRSVVEVQRVLHLAGNPNDGRFPAPPRRLAGRQSPGPRTVARGLVPTRPDPTIEIQAAVAQQIARVVEAGCKLAVVDLLLGQAVLHGPVLALELGHGPAQLGVLILQVAQTGLELSGRRSPGEERASSRTAGQPAQQGAGQQRANPKLGGWPGPPGDAGPKRGWTPGPAAAETPWVR